MKKEEKPYSPGLEGVIAGTTSISEVDPQRQKLAYRGYDIEELAAHASYEEVAYLLLYGELPAGEELSSFSAELASARKLPPAVYGILKLMPLSVESMDALRTAVSFLGATDPEVRDNSREANLRKSIRLISQMATIIAAHYRMRAGLSPLDPDPGLSHAANFFTMITDRKPEPFEARPFEISLILYAEHSFNASTFSSRVIASTLADMHAAVAGAIGALKGPLHGGANERVMEMLLEIGEPSKAETWILNALKEKRRIMGFGHRVYKWGDSRVPTLKRIGRELAGYLGETRWVEIAETVERVMEREKGLYPNADFPCAPLYFMLGLPSRLYTPLFAAARIAGWAAHVIEQHGDNRLIRPDSIYRGERHRAYVPFGQRKSGKR